ncbi:hypothetical protein SAICODRAFT_23497 [Saitoella complicata NRRL Y-17804]|uniref:uncharacterized protein n=1 Tax=Saitoella complicata (strain BCRC 22490 / CBS 7301 / JCM 7358 / NBRC 10748 / NRRL Y-17804) TaxID=698492 RepID=UPI0008681B97|nr:uncharacterized protein SAICODRAFT_23497 [Saitoella complicata NRRL Y-17804]ODQ55459.1 hypothetical protein SAICODRAFT_23497 [Saitoella complicata NRRL Y-17804]
MGLRGHNAMVPCRFCKVVGSPYRHSGNRTTYYDPLPHPSAPLVQDNPNPTNPVPTSYRTARLPMRNDRDHRYDMQRSMNKLETIDFPRSFPINIMHLTYQGPVLIMVEHWEGTLFKDEDLAEPWVQNWEEFGKSLADAAKTTLLAYGRARRISQRTENFTKQKIGRTS